MLVSLCPKPVNYTSAASCQQTVQRIKQHLSPHQNNPTASDRGAKGGGEKNTLWGEGEKKEREKPKGICKSNSNQRLHLTVLRNVKPWILSANVQDEVQTIYFIFIYFKTDAVALYFIIQDFQRRQTEFLQPN